MSTTPHANDRQMDRLDAEAREQRAASELAPSESTGPARPLAVATGSVVVPAGVLIGLAALWDRVASDKRRGGGRYNPPGEAARAEASALSACAQELRLLVEDAGERQPPRNNVLASTHLSFAQESLRKAQPMA